MKANALLTERDWRERSRAEQREGAVKVHEEKPEGAKTQEGIEYLHRVKLGQEQRIGNWKRP